MNDNSKQKDRPLQYFRVNDRPVNLTTAMAWSEIEDLPSFVDATRMRVAILNYGEHAGIQVSKEELQQIVDDIRYDLALEDAEATRRWLKNDRISETALLEMALVRAFRRAIGDSATSEELRAYYEANIDDFVLGDIYLIRLADAAQANKIADDLRAGRGSFYECAIALSEDAETSGGAGYIGRVPKSHFSESLALSLFGVDPGDIVGPIQKRKVCEIYLVKEIHKPSFEELETEIRDLWLNEKLYRLASEAMVTLGDL